MSDDIVTLLREDFCDFGQWENSCTPEGKCPCCLAADEIERLQADRDRWRKIADGMAGCLDSSCEAGDLLNEYEQAVRGEG